MNIYEKAAANEALARALADPAQGHASVAIAFGVSEQAVRRWRRKNGVKREVPPALPKGSYSVSKEGSGSIDVTPDGARVNNIIVTSPVLTDWTPVFGLFNLDASIFEVVNDTVKMSTWQQSKALDDGTRDIIQLYSYSAQFTKKKQKGQETKKSADEWRNLLISDRPATPLVPPVIDSTYLILVSDPQLGKKGTEEAVENWQRGISNHVALAATTQADIHVAFMGDETENVANHYANQPATIELNRTDQLELDFNMRVWTLREALKYSDSVSASSVISNHGEWTRNGSKDVVTSKNDNASTYIARQVKTLFDELSPFTDQHIHWTIGDGAPGVVLNLSGVKSYFTHGHIEKGKGVSTEARVKTAMEAQILGNTREYGDIDLFYTAHYHHNWQTEDRGRTFFGTPALEAERSSEYMLEQYGVWSPPGMLGMLVSSQFHRKYASINIF